MAYIGAQPNKTLTETTSQSFNGTGSATAFTLNRAVNTGEELEVFVDNVQQEPGSGKSYTATGTTLTFDEAPPLGTGNVYVIYRGQAEVTTRLEAPDLSITTAKLASPVGIDTTSSTFKMTDVSSNAFYRTGTWTATDASGNGLSLTQDVTAQYVRIGDLVYVNFYVTYPSSGGNSSTAVIGGLPFQAATNKGYHYLAGRIQDYGAADVRVQIQQGTTTGIPQQNNTGMLNSQLAVNRYVIMSGCYIAESGT